MKITKTQIYVIAGALGLTIGAIVGRYIYLNNTEETDGIKNYTPDVEYAITHGENK